MSRDSQIIRKDIEFDSIAGDSTLGDITLNGETWEFYMAPQRNLIGYLTEQILLIAPGNDRFKSELLAAELIADQYHRWFKQQVGLLHRDRFSQLYGGIDGPQNLFQALFPEQEVGGLLRAYLSCQGSEDLVKNDLEAIHASLTKTLEVA